MSKLLTVDVIVPSSQHLSPNPSSHNSSMSSSPRSRPRLSFDETSLIKQQDDKRRDEDSDGPIATITVPPLSSAVTTNHINSSSENLRRASTPGNLPERPDGGESIGYRPSISISSHPSIQEDLCSEIVRLDTVSGSDHHSKGPKEKGEQKKLGTFVTLYRVITSLSSFHSKCNESISLLNNNTGLWFCRISVNGRIIELHLSRLSARILSLRNSSLAGMLREVKEKVCGRVVEWIELLGISGKRR